MKLYTYKTVVSCLITATCFTWLSASYNDTPLPALPLNQYRPENTQSIMRYYYVANEQNLQSLQEIKVSSGIRFHQFERQQLPLFVMQLIDHADDRAYRQCFKQMLVEEVFKKIPLYSCLARKFTQPNPETPVFLQQTALLFSRLKIHACAIDELLDAPEIQYDQLICHCREKVRICRSINDLILSSYQE